MTTNSVATQPPEAVVEDGSDDEDSHENADALIQEKVGPSSGVTGSSLQQPPKVMLSSSKQFKPIQFKQLKHEREALRRLITDAVNIIYIDPTSVPSRPFVMDILIKIREIDNQLTEDPDQWDTIETSLRNDFSSKIQFIGKAISEQELKDKSVQSPPNATNVATTTHGANVTDVSAPATIEPTVSPQVITNSSPQPTTEIATAQTHVYITQNIQHSVEPVNLVGPSSQTPPPISVAHGNMPQSAVNSSSVPFNQLMQQNQLLNLPPSSASGLGGHFATRNSSSSAQSLNTCTSSGVQMCNSVPPSSTRAESGDGQSASASYAQTALPQQQPVGQAEGPSHWTGALLHPPPHPPPEPPPPPPPHRSHQPTRLVNRSVDQWSDRVHLGRRTTPLSQLRIQIRTSIEPARISLALVPCPTQDNKLPAAPQGQLFQNHSSRGRKIRALDP